MAKIRTSISAKEVKNELGRHFQSFAYRKKDGSLRIAKGTLDPSIIPEDQRPAGTGTPKPDNIVSYWDMNVEGWRAFDINSLLWMHMADGNHFISEYADYDELSEILFWTTSNLN